VLKRPSECLRGLQSAYRGHGSDDTRLRLRGLAETLRVFLEPVHDSSFTVHERASSRRKRAFRGV
jgi:hypothetical protein